MIVVSNRIPVAPGQEAAFERRFRDRAGLVDRHPGFVRLEILRPTSIEMHEVIQTADQAEASRSAA